MNRKPCYALTFILLALAGAPRAQAQKSATVEVGDPLNTTETRIFISSKHKGPPERYLKYCSVLIPGGISALEKTRKIYETCNGHPFDIEWDRMSPKLTFKNLHEDTDYMEFNIGDSAEFPDRLLEETQQGWPRRIRVIPLDKATVAFENPMFNPFDVLGRPAVFTAGIVTDVGELTAQVSAQELNFQTEGPIICQALFQRLAPRAPQYGAQINYAGDRLEIHFDPAHTVQRSGVVFGTNSPSPGCFALLGLPDFVKGDLNCDGALDAFDIEPFTLALSDPAGYVQQFPDCGRMVADINGDGNVDAFDIEPFIQLLTGP